MRAGRGEHAAARRPGHPGAGGRRGLCAAADRQHRAGRDRPHRRRVRGDARIDGRVRRRAGPGRRGDDVRGEPGRVPGRVVRIRQEPLHGRPARPAPAQPDGPGQGRAAAGHRPARRCAAGHQRAAAGLPPDRCGVAGAGPVPGLHPADRPPAPGGAAARAAPVRRDPGGRRGAARPRGGRAVLRRAERRVGRGRRRGPVVEADRQQRHLDTGVLRRRPGRGARLGAAPASGDRAGPELLPAPTPSRRPTSTWTPAWPPSPATRRASATTRSCCSWTSWCCGWPSRCRTGSSSAASRRS